MEFEEIIKRVEWLDEQQRKSRTEVGEFKGRLTSLDAGVESLGQQLKGLSQQVKDISLAAARMGQFDQIMTKHRSDLAKMIETGEKSAIRREQESTKLHHAELEEIQKVVHQVSSVMSTEEAARKDRSHDELRRSVAAQDTRVAVEATVRQGKEILEAQRALEESRRQDAKRIADLQGEVASLRKRADEVREKTTLHSDSIRNLENRMTELVETEASRQERHAALLQQQALTQVERDRAWREWQEKYDGFRQQAGNVETQVAAFEDSIRAAQRAQEAYDGLNQRLERRIAEVGEIQRLAEERIRQEWVSFKADEQKRWAGHSLSQDEFIRDLRKDVDKVDKRLTALDDVAQTMQDQLHQTTDTTEKQLQELMNLTQEWLTAFERIMGHSKAKARKPAR